MSSQSAKTQRLTKHFQAVEKNLKSLEKEIAAYIKSSRNQYEKSLEFATTLELMEHQEGSPALKTALKTVARSVTDSGISQQKMINVMESNILCQFGNYPAGIKTKRTATKTRGRAFKNLVKVHAGWQKASSKNTGQQTLQKKRNAYETAMKEMVTEEQKFNEDMGEFEGYRVKESKEMLLAFTQGKIHYHARALAALTEAYAAVQAVDPEEESRNMQRMLRSQDREMDSRFIKPSNFDA